MKFLPNTIINFHAVYDKAWMEKIFLLLKKNYHIVSALELEMFYYQGYKLKNACHITFDDGDLSFYKNVFPLLEKHQIPVSIYVSPLIILEKRNFWFQEIYGYDINSLLEILESTTQGKTKHSPKAPLGALLKNMPLEGIWQVIEKYQKETGTPMKPCMNMNKGQLIKLHRTGLVTIGAHTQNHPILKNESDETVEIEITESIDQLSILLQSEVNFFSYPNGTPQFDFGQREINILKSAGIQIAFSTENNTISSKDDPFSVPRNGIIKSNTAFLMTKLFAGRHWEFFKTIIKRHDENKYRCLKI